MSGRIDPDVEAYLERIETPQFRRALEELRAQIRAVVPDADEVISYGQPTFKQDGHLVAYAAFKRHLSFFPMSSSAIDEHAEALKDYKTSKGTVQFLTERPIPPDVVEAIVRRRVADNAAAAAARGLRKRR